MMGCLRGALQLSLDSFLAVLKLLKLTRFQYMNVIIINDVLTLNEVLIQFC